MNFVIPTSQPAPTIYSRSSRIIAVASVIVIITLIVALILQCIKSWHINFIGAFTLIACFLAHLCWIVSTVNMLSQNISKRLIRLNQVALITPNAIIVMVILVATIIYLISPEYKYRLTHNQYEALLYIFAFTPPIIAWITNTAIVIRSMIKTHQYLKS